jgi:quinol-cytochrome oxidoreductase complex cytochrome b subunit
MKNLILHLHPKSIPASSLAFNRTFGLGGIAVVLFIIQVLSGILLRFFYEPVAGDAYFSVLHIHNQVLFGAFIRNIHHWAGVFLVVIVFLHLLRTFLSAALYAPRHINWFMGIILFLLVILANFSGYLLPWDQLAYWAVTISTGILSYFPVLGESLRQTIVRGEEISGNTLTFFYTWHTALLPGIISIIMLFHFWLVRKSGGIVDPQQTSEMVPVNPNLIYREWIVMLAVTAFVLILAVLFNAPLQELANPAFSPSPIKAPWYFAGIQELLLHFHPLLGGILVPLALVAFFSAVPLIPVHPKPDGTWFVSAKGRKATIPATLISFGLTFILVLADGLFPSFKQIAGNWPALMTDGLLPFVIVMGLFWICLYFLQKRYNLNRAESVLIWGISLITIFVTLTFIGNFMRGADMQLQFFFSGQG